MNALCREIRAAPAFVAETVYLGGGTPSLLSSAQLDRLFGELKIQRGAEVTMEAAPGTISPENWRGINRVSMGVQSFVERELRAVGRPHSFATVAADAAALRAAGITNIGFDLIAGLPHQTETSWEDSLEGIARLRPAHVSVYILEIDEDSRLGAEVLAGGIRYSARALPDENLAADLYSRAVERLGQLGYTQYEISNFALPGFESRHNRKYWDGAPYFGFGVDAHSFDGCERWANTGSLEEYLERVARGESPVIERRRLSGAERAQERAFLGLRRNEGIALPISGYEREIDELTAAGLLESTGGRLRLTARGRLLSNEVFAIFV